MRLSDDQTRQLRQAANLGITVRDFGDALVHLGKLLFRYPDEVLRGGIRHAVAVERYYITAQTIGVSKEDADRTLAESRQHLTEWPWWFDATEDAEQRLKMGLGSPMSRPSVEFRRAARDVLATDAELYGRTYTPADVDALAIRFEEGLT